MRSCPEPHRHDETRKILAACRDRPSPLLWMSPAARGGGSRPRAAEPAAPFQLHDKDHICIIGNTLAERMQYDGWLETMLHARFPQHDWSSAISGSAATKSRTRLRSKNFGTPDEWLSGQGDADRRLRGEPLRRHEHQGGRRLRVLRLQRVVRRRGRARGVPAAARRMDHATRWRRSTTASPRRASSSSRRSRTRICTIRICRTARRTTRGWQLYTRRWRRSPRRAGITFVDLFTPSAQLYAAAKAPLTIQGIHLNAEGNRRIARDHRPRAVRRAEDVHAALPRRAAPGGGRQGLPLVQPLPGDRRVRDLRRPRVPHVHPRQSARRQPRERSARSRRRTSSRPTTRCSSAKPRCST